MADNTEQYVFQHLITLYGYRPYIYRYGEMLFAPMSMKMDDNYWVDLFISLDDGITWEYDENVPTSAYILTDIKMIIVDTTWYLFAHGLSESGIDCIYFIRKTYDEETNAMYWDTEWHLLFEGSAYNNRITDLAVDDEHSFIHLMYDQYTVNGTYNVRYAMYSIANDSVQYDFAIHASSSVNQNNAHVVMLNNYIVGVIWEQENNASIKQIWYGQYDLLNTTWLFQKQISTDEEHHSYHASITVDDTNVVYLTWLNTQNNYKTDVIYYAMLVDEEIKELTILNTEAKANQYPLILYNDDKLYVLYNSSNDTVNYYVKSVYETDWTSVDSLHNNTWDWTNGIMYGDNIYTIVNCNVDYSTETGMHLVRIDTNILNATEAINDFQITAVNNEQIAFSWSFAKNAEELYIQQLAEDSWKQGHVTNVNGDDTLDYDTTHTEAINLDDGIYKFRIIYTRADKSTDYLDIDGVYTVDNSNGKQNVILDWVAPTDAVKQALYYTKETWNDIQQVDRTAISTAVTFDGRVTRFRLKIVGGEYEGVSNEAQPLTVELVNDKLVFNWLSIDTDIIYLQKSLDGNEWFNTNIDINNTSTDVTCDATDVYRYRLAYLTDESTVYSNCVSLTTDLQAISYDYQSITLHWTSISSTETTKFQYSINDGLDWKTVNLATSDSTAILKALNYDTKYWIRLYFPNRITGCYSNTITVTTAKKPIDDLILISQPNSTSATLEFTITESFTDVTVTLFDILMDGESSKSYNNYSPIITTTKSNATKVSFTIPDLLLGTTYDVAVTPLGSKYGDYSNMVRVNTTGIAPQNFQAVAINDHSITFQWDTLDRITSSNVLYMLYIAYSNNNGITWNTAIITDITNNQFTIDNLYQNTTYLCKMQCLYGDNEGVTSPITVTTLADNFDAILGERVPNERSCAKIDNIIYICDDDKVYTYDLSTNTQALLYDLGLGRVTYSSMLVDKNQRLHLVCAHNNKLYYYTNCKNKTQTFSFSTPQIIYDNSLVNRCLSPNMAINDKNQLYIVWENDFGNYSNVNMVMYTNGEVVLEPLALIQNTKYNHSPKIALTSNGWYVVSITDESNLIIVHNIINNDYNDVDTYLSNSISIDAEEMTNPYTDSFNNFNILVDNIDTLRIFYDSYSDDLKTTTYATVSNDKYEYKEQSVFTSTVSDSVMFAGKELIMVGRNVQNIYTGHFMDDKFTNIMAMNDTVESNPLLVCYENDNIYVIGTVAGKWKILQKSADDIAKENKYVDGLWIDNQFTIQNDDEDYVIELWTNGDINKYPSMYLKCNNITKDITPLDEYGEYADATIVVSNMEAVDITDSQYSAYVTTNTKSLIKITYNNGTNDKDIFIDITDWMYYTWDYDTIINSASK